MIKLLTHLRRVGTLEVTKAITMKVAKHNVHICECGNSTGLGGVREDLLSWKCQVKRGRFG
jgi:hypothetical protein